MKLASARSLKEEVLSTLVTPYMEIASARAGPSRAATRMVESLSASAMSMPASAVSLAVSAQPLGQVQGVHRAIAVGVARVGKEYRLAVRIQRQQFRDPVFLDAIRKKAKNEIEVKVIGKVTKRAIKQLKVTTAKKTSFKQFLATPPWYRSNMRPLIIGASVGHYAITAGTLGAFVRCDGATCILSNNHVLANEDRGGKGDDVLQRAAYDGGSRPGDKVATLRDWKAFTHSGANYIDAALAAIDDGVDFDPVLLRGVRGADRRMAGQAAEPVDVGDILFKVGRTTGVTRGRVTAFDLDNVVVGFDIGNLRFDNQIEIEGAGGDSFSDGGDSGSLILNSKMEAVALLFAGSEQGGTNGRGMTFACPIGRVLTDLKATLLS